MPLGPPGLRAMIEGARKLRDDGEHEEAFAIVEEALERFPDEPQAHLSMAFHVKRSDEDAAAAHLHDALALAPDDPEVIMRAAFVYVTLRDLDEAAALVERVADVDLDAFSSEAKEQVALVRGLMALIDDEDERAERLFRRAVEINPARPQYAHLLAQVLLDLGRPEDALQVVRAAREHHPDDDDLADLMRVTLNAVAGSPSSETAGNPGGAQTTTSELTTYSQWPPRDDEAEEADEADEDA